METPDKNSLVLNLEPHIEYFMRFKSHQQRPFFWRQYLPRTRSYFCDPADDFRSSHQGSGCRGRFMAGIYRYHICAISCCEAAKNARERPWNLHLRFILPGGGRGPSTGSHWTRQSKGCTMLQRRKHSSYTMCRDIEISRPTEAISSSSSTEDGPLFPILLINGHK